jgi:hypothetical protein
MGSSMHRKCCHCGRSFVPDYRNAYHQRFCSEPDCRRASKQTSQRRWLRKPENRNYYREPDNVRRVREWRVGHPGYWRELRQRCQAVQTAETRRPSCPAISTLPALAGTLQEVCRWKLPVLTGIIERLERCTLQEDIAVCATQMLLEAQCILLQCQARISLPVPALAAVNCHESG